MRKWILGVVLWIGLTVVAWAAAFAPGDKVEIYSAHQWAPGVVREVKGDQFKVGFDGYSEVWDAWVTAAQLRKVAAAPSTAAPTASVAVKIGDRVEAKTFGMWFEGTVGAVEGNRVYVRFDDKTESWIAAENVRLSAAAAPVDKPVATTRPANAKAGLEGAYLRVESFFMGTSLTLKNEGWFFTKDGKFSKTPQGGFSFKDFAPKRKSDGTYWITGGKITFAFADGSKPLVYDFENTGNEIKWGGVGATRVEGFKPGWRLEGAYEGGSSIGGGALMSSSTIVFRRDGTYARESIANIQSTSSKSVVSGGTQTAAVGTYAFDGFTLTLKPNDAPAANYTVFAFGDKDAAGRPEYIYRDGVMMKRQG